MFYWTQTSPSGTTIVQPNQTNATHKFGSPILTSIFTYVLFFIKYTKGRKGSAIKMGTLLAYHRYLAAFYAGIIKSCNKYFKSISFSFTSVIVVISIFY